MSDNETRDHKGLLILACALFVEFLIVFIPETATRPIVGVLSPLVEYIGRYWPSFEALTASAAQPSNLKALMMIGVLMLIVKTWGWVELIEPYRLTDFFLENKDGRSRPSFRSFVGVSAILMLSIFVFVVDGSEHVDGGQSELATIRARHSWLLAGGIRAWVAWNALTTMFIAPVLAYFCWLVMAMFSTSKGIDK